MREIFLNKKRILFLALSALIIGAGLSLLFFKVNRTLPKSSDIMNLQDHYSLSVQPIFNSKCVACHSCYNSPCQLNLTSYEGVQRGASAINLYDFPKLEDRDPTRLFVDANNVEDWHNKKGFFSVTATGSKNILEYLITVPPSIESGLQKEYDAEYSRVCIDSLTDSNIKKFTALNPAGRMPLGFPPLAQQEVQTIKDWLAQGAKGPGTLYSEAKIREHADFKDEIQNWEDFFNGTSVPQKLVSRYLYEHLFLASLYFESNPAVFFRLVRSKTANGDVVEIGTSLPFDDPGKFTYRLRPITSTLVHKSHMPFQLSQGRQKQWKKEFLESPWKTIPQQLPAYGKEGSNPFTTFAAIPVRARYQFFLDNAGYHIMSFIKGPVCRGQTALNVINDHFWVLFMDPAQDVMVNSPEAYDKISRQVEFPSSIGDDLSPMVKFREEYWNSVDTKFQYLKKQKNLRIDSLWNANKVDSNATITVYRHFDSATVLRGLRGQTPKTVWVLDYQVFESIYYNLTAGYNVFGPILHQINSRLFMEVSRIASEDLFLSFLPHDTRVTLRKDWNLPAPKKKESILKWIEHLVISDVRDKLEKEYAYAGISILSDVLLKDRDKKEEFLTLLKTEHYSPIQYAPVLDEEPTLSQLKKLPPSTVQHLPDTILLKVEDEKDHKLWTLVHNRAHYNVAMLFLEDDRLRPEKDYLDVISNTATSYANLIMVIKKSQLDEFVKDFTACTSEKMVQAFLKKYGLSRSHPKFWDHYNEVSKLSSEVLTNEQGYFDLNRYNN